MEVLGKIKSKKIIEAAMMRMKIDLEVVLAKLEMGAINSKNIIQIITMDLMKIMMINLL